MQQLEEMLSVNKKEIGQELNLFSKTLNNWHQPSDIGVTIEHYTVLHNYLKRKTNRSTCFEFLHYTKVKGNLPKSTVSKIPYVEEITFFYSV